MDDTLAGKPVTDDTSENPLLAWGEIPDFAAITPEHVVPAVRETLARSAAALEALEAEAAALSATDLLHRLEALEDRLGWTWGLANHLNSVRTSDALRQAITLVQPEVVTFHSRLGQSQPLYRAYRAIADGPGFAALDPAARRVVTLAIRAAEHAGVGLDGEARERFNTNQQRLAQLGMEFGDTVLDATKAWSLLVTDPADVGGLPESLRALLAQQAQAAGHEGATSEAGPWRLTLDGPVVMPFLEHADARALRETVYRAYVGRAGPETPELDNAPRILEMLALRREQARALGFATFAELSLAAKMAPSVEAVERLLGDLHAASRPAALRELDELTTFAQAHGHEGALALWDAAYWARRLREARFAYSDEDLRPYFPLDQVLSGLFGLVKRLFGVTIRRRDGIVGWHPDVSYHEVRDDAGEVIAGFYLDPYSRPADKRGGAWMNECRGRSRLAARDTRPGQMRTPIAYLVCNQSPPVGDKPSLMTWSEVSTLFHELGHGLQHMLTKVELGPVAGINGVEWDAVELPSQFMENWLKHRPTLAGFARHYQTGETIPDALVDRVLAASTFRAGSAFLRQLYFARLDLELHHRYEASAGGAPTIWEVQRRIAADNTVIAPLENDRFLCAFAHLFAGGYAAGYYSYKWAEVLSADAFSAFEEAGLDDEARLTEVGHRFRDTVLALGGSVPPMEVYTTFRGREPTTDALLRHNGLQAA
ncbi:MAG: M3 family metallopeptidase [Deltaproteobacteria bacterium]|nr:M3 family metallopeptidase [Deltaproteobacteria bacterium]